MAILPVGIRQEMKTQIFRIAQNSEQPEKSSVYMQTGASAPVPEVTADLPENDVSQDSEIELGVLTNSDDIHDFVYKMLVLLGCKERSVTKNLDKFVKDKVGPDGDHKGFFMIPKHTEQRKVSLTLASKIVEIFSKKFNMRCDITPGNNFLIEFPSSSKLVDTSNADEEGLGSLGSIVGSKGENKKTSSSILEEQFSIRQAMLVDTLKKLGYKK